MQSLINYIIVILKLINNKGYIWLLHYIKKISKKTDLLDYHEKHVIFLMCDHFEPSRYDKDQAAVKVKDWCEKYASAASRHQDSDGVHPKHSWFYRFDFPSDDCLNVVADLCFRSLGEIEFHLHHGYDTPSDFSRKIDEGVDWFQSYGAMVSIGENPLTNFAYIAGNWALDNGRREPQFSGVDNEIKLLSKYNCYADFTFPAFGVNSQPRICNDIYYAIDNGRAKSYDTGKLSYVGFSGDYDLMIFQGGLYIDWKKAIIEFSAYESYCPYYEGREDYWLKSNIHIAGRPEWIFIKLHTHGMQSKSVFESEVLDNLFSSIESKYTQNGMCLHYVTAREAYNIVKAAEQGKKGNPNSYRDYIIPPPANTMVHVNTSWKLLCYTDDIIELLIHEPKEETIIKLKFHDVCLISGPFIRRLYLAYNGSSVEIDAAASGEIVVHYTDK
jgi:hypothetical protein